MLCCSLFSVEGFSLSFSLSGGLKMEAVLCGRKYKTFRYIFDSGLDKYDLHG